MTADQIFDRVIALMFAAREEKEEYESGFFGLLNLKLAESFRVNNALRTRKGKDVLAAVPVLSLGEQEVPYESELTDSLFPYGIAGDLFAEDDETGISNIYRERYIVGLQQVAPAAWSEVSCDEYDA